MVAERASVEDERVSFEDWCRGEYLPTHQDADGYVNRFTRVAWAAWECRANRTVADVSAMAAAIAKRHVRGRRLLGET